MISRKLLDIDIVDEAMYSVADPDGIRIEVQQSKSQKIHLLTLLKVLIELYFPKEV